MDTLNFLIDNDAENEMPSMKRENCVTPPPVDVVKPIEIYKGAEFTSFASFKEALTRWIAADNSYYRIASSEKLRDTLGNIDNNFVYKYIVYHCPRYGHPRCRGIGIRPNQSYLSNNCKATLRINYIYATRVLRITKVDSRHNHSLRHENECKHYRRNGSTVFRKQPSKRGRKPKQCTKKQSVQPEKITSQSESHSLNTVLPPAFETVVPPVSELLAALDVNNENIPPMLHGTCSQIHSPNNDIFSHFPTLQTPQTSSVTPIEEPLNLQNLVNLVAAYQRAPSNVKPVDEFLAMICASAV